MTGKEQESHLEKQFYNWAEFINFYESGLMKREDQWIFRGQSNSKWRLQTSLERAMDDFSIGEAEAPDIEHGLLRKFQRQCHHFEIQTPEEKDSLEWLALMQHYRAPTRLLDWTYSPFVALYFAVESAVEVTTEGACESNGGSAKKWRCAVWAFNINCVDRALKTVLDHDLRTLKIWKDDPNILRPYTFDKLFMPRVQRNPIPFVAPVTPRRMNERLVLQQGVFLCPGDVRKSFHENMDALLCKAEPNKNFYKLVLQVDMEQKKDFLLKLHRMNMNSATLFPGMQGFAQSLRSLMAAPGILLNPGN